MDRTFLSRECDRIFGQITDPITLVARRAELARPTPIVWEGDASTFQFTYVSPIAETMLGFAADRWLEEAAFWAEKVVHPDDRLEAIAYCALATGKRADHEFEYRAVRADGSALWLLDVVRVVVGSRGVAERLRGLMFDVTDEKAATGLGRTGELPTRPTREELEGQSARPH